MPTDAAGHESKTVTLVKNFLKREKITQFKKEEEESQKEKLSSAISSWLARYQSYAFYAEEIGGSEEYTELDEDNLSFVEIYIYLVSLRYIVEAYLSSENYKSKKYDLEIEQNKKERKQILKRNLDMQEISQLDYEHQIKNLDSCYAPSNPKVPEILEGLNFLIEKMESDLGKYYLCTQVFNFEPEKHAELTEEQKQEAQSLVDEISSLHSNIDASLKHIDGLIEGIGREVFDVDPAEVLERMSGATFKTRRNCVHDEASNICTRIESLLEGLNTTNEQAEVASVKTKLKEGLSNIQKAADYDAIEAGLNSMQNSITDMAKLACVKEYPKTNNIFKKLLNAIKTLIRWVCEQKGFKKLEMALYSKSQNTLHGFAQQLGEESNNVKRYRLNPL